MAERTLPPLTEITGVSASSSFVYSPLASYGSGTVLVARASSHRVFQGFSRYYALVSAAVSSNAIPPGPEQELAYRQTLKRRMPSRSRIQAIIDRRRGLSDPWLDDEHD